MKQHTLGIQAAGSVVMFACFILSGMAQAQNLLPTWNGSFTDQFEQHNNVYPFTMVGTDPSQSDATTTIPVYLVPVAVTFAASDNSNVCGPGSVTFDASTTVLWDGEKLTDNVVGSPLFTPITGFPEQGNSPSLQYIDAFQRGNFWGYVQSQNTSYHVKLGTPTLLAELALPSISPHDGEAVNGNPDSGYAGCVGVGDIYYLARQFELLLSSGELVNLPSDSLIIFLTYDVFGQGVYGPPWFPQGGGVHGVSTVLGTSQTWVWGTYNGGLQDANDKGYCGFDSHGNPITCWFQDVDDLSHEIGEWADDPFGHTPAPCSDNASYLEVGDPLTDSTTRYYVYPGANNGYAYHLQDLVFLPYFGAAPASLAYDSQLTFQGEGSAQGVSYCFNGG